jgi:hypothetical protein
MTRQQMLADSVRLSGSLVARYFMGFDQTNHTKTGPGLPNHFAWTLGHLALTIHGAAAEFDGGALPVSDFVCGDGRGDDADRYDPAAIGFGSAVPGEGPARWPAHGRCVAIFEGAVARLASAVEHATDAELDATVQWGAMEVALWTLPIRMVNHNGTHCGQLVDLRRALGMSRLFG